MFTPETERADGAFMLSGSGAHQRRECRRAIAWLSDCAARCGEADVSEEIGPAIAYLERHIYKPVIARRFRAALAVPDPVLRKAAAHEALAAIARGVPLATDGK